MIAVAALLGVARQVYATSLTWDAGGTSASGPLDGSGTWDTTTNANWSNGSSDLLWNADATGASDTAVFGSSNGAAGTVTLGSALSAGSISFLAPGSGSYIVGNSTNQLTLASGDVSVAVGVSATITSPVAGSNGLTVTGGGALSLGGLGTTSPVAYTGDTTVNNSTLSFNNLTTSTAITLGNGTSNVNLSGANSILNSKIAQSKQFFLNANLVIANGTNATINFSPRTYIGVGGSASSVTTVTGGVTSTLNLVANTTLDRDLFYDSASGFSGTLNIQPASIASSPIIFEGTGGSYSSSAAGYFSGTPGTFNVNGELSTANPTPGNTYTIGAFGGASTGIIDTPISGGTATWLVGGLGLSTIYAGAINGNNALAVTGGSLTLTGSNTYTGGTTIKAGLLVSGSGLTGVGTGPVVINGGAAIFSNTSAGTIFATLQAGYNSGAWNGSGGITSATATADAKRLHALGFLQPTTATAFEGQPLGIGDVAVKYTYYGDTNLDGKVDASDYSRIDSGFLTGATGWQNGDFNYDGVINGSDYTLIDNAFNTQSAQINDLIANPSAIATAQIAGETSAVPEPVSVGFLGVGALTLLCRHRKPRGADHS